MLVLTEKGLAIMIHDPKTGDLVEVAITEIKGDQVSLGVEAPKDVAVHRKKIWEQIEQENRAAAVSELT